MIESAIYAPAQVPLTNPSFESGNSGWYLSGSSVSAASPRTGGNSLQMTGPNASGSSYVLQSVNLTADTTYRLEAFAKTEALTAGRAYLAVEYYDASGVCLGGDQSRNLVQSASYDDVSLVFTPPAAQTQTRILLVLEANSSGTVRWDDVILSVQPSLSGYGLLPDSARPVAPAIQNAGFESGVASWYASTGTTVDQKTKYQGAYSLRFSSGAYVTQNRSLQSNVAYTLGGFLKTSNLAGGTSWSKGITLNVEFYNAAGAWIGGTSSTGLKGSAAWTYQKLDFVVPSNTVNTRIVVSVETGMRGQAWADSLSLAATQPVFSTALLHPYQETLTPGTSELVLSTNLSSVITNTSYPITEAQTSLWLQYSDDKGASISQWIPVFGERGRAVFTGLIAGASGQIRVRLISDQYSWVLADQTIPVHVRATTSLSFNAVTLDNMGRMHINGPQQTLFLPTGLYGHWSSSIYYSSHPRDGGLNTSDIDNIAASSYNFIMPYDGEYLRMQGQTPSIASIRSALDYLYYQKNLRVLFSLKQYDNTIPDNPVYQWTNGGQLLSGGNLIATTLVNSLKDHPAILGWYIADEPSVDDIAKVQARRRLVQSLDLDHPTVVTLTDNATALMPRFVGLADILMFDSYPVVGTGSATMQKVHDGMTALQAAAGLPEGAAIWGVPQFHNIGAYFPAQYSSYRAPTEAEMKALVLEYVSHGARGIIGFGYTELLLNDAATVFNQRWAEVKRVGELFATTLRPYVLSSQPISPVSFSGTSSVEIVQLKTDSLQIAAIITNFGVGSQTATFGFPSASSMFGLTSYYNSSWTFVGTDISADLLR